MDAAGGVALRLERQKALVSERAPTFHAVLDEAALRRPYGEREVMRAQLRHLIDMSERPNITLQVDPLSHGGHAGESGSFTMLRFPESDLSDIVYLEQLADCALSGQARGSRAVRKGDGDSRPGQPRHGRKPGSSSRTAPTDVKCQYHDVTSGVCERLQ
ncbi:hypothetical protein SCALM49S_01622 [Streptomyces californicus]